MIDFSYDANLGKEESVKVIYLHLDEPPSLFWKDFVQPLQQCSLKGIIPLHGCMIQLQYIFSSILSCRYENTFHPVSFCILMRCSVLGKIAHCTALGILSKTFLTIKILICVGLLKIYYLKKRKKGILRPFVFQPWILSWNLNRNAVGLITSKQCKLLA